MLHDATTFLTRVPLPPRSGPDLARAAWALPVVGALLGAVVAGIGLGAGALLPLTVAAVLAVAAEVVLTGALHLDGLADCADGAAGRDRASRLAIMKDHQVGVYGAAAVLLDLLLKVALVHAVLAGPWSAGTTVALLAAAWALSRASVLPPARWLRYARAQGTGALLVTGLTWTRVVAGVLVSLAVLAGAALVLPLPVVLGLLLGAVGATTAVSLWARSQLGGVTGDALGACVELGLLAALTTGLALA
jgi:adenosylcobinamide-GDP ribazoletransferase